MMAGRWWVPEDGFVWDDHLREAMTSTPQEVGPWLRMKRSDEQAIVRRYPVLNRPQLLAHFWHVAEDPSMDRIRRFANRWGWLGRDTAVAPENGGTVQNAEALSIWWDELLKFRSLYEMWKAVRVIDQSDVNGITRVKDAWFLLKDRIVWHQDKTTVAYRAKIQFSGAAFTTPEGWMPNFSTHEVFAMAGTTEGDSLLARWETNDVLEPARYYVHKKVNGKLKGKVNLAVLPFLKGRMRFFPENLLAAIYVYFARELAGARSLERECEFCHQPFAPGRRDQRFCHKNCRELAGYHRRKGDSVAAIQANPA